MGAPPAGIGIRVRCRSPHLSSAALELSLENKRVTSTRLKRKAQTVASATAVHLIQHSWKLSEILKKAPGDSMVLFIARVENDGEAWRELIGRNDLPDLNLKGALYWTWKKRCQLMTTCWWVGSHGGEDCWTDVTNPNMIMRVSWECLAPVHEVFNSSTSWRISLTRHGIWVCHVQVLHCGNGYSEL